MTPHVLACGSEYFWCSNEHANGWAFLMALGTGIVIVGVLIIAAAIAGHRDR